MAKADRRIEDTGPLTKKRMETIDDETVAAAKDFITRMNAAGKPFFCWWNGTRMHFRTHVRDEHRHPGNDEYSDGMIEHDMHVGELLALIDELGIADNTIVQYSTDNGPHYNTWPDAGTTPFRSEKNSNWEGAYPRAGFHPLAGQVPCGNHAERHCEPRGLAPHIRRCRGQCEHQGPAVKRHHHQRSHVQEPHRWLQLDGLPEGKSKESPRHEFMYVNDDGQIVAIRYDDWKSVFLENRGVAFEVWREPWAELRVPLLFNLRRDPFEKAQHNSNTYNDWFLERVFVLAPMQTFAAKFLMTMKDYPPSQTAGSFNLEKVQKQIESSMGGK